MLNTRLFGREVGMELMGEALRSHQLALQSPYFFLSPLQIRRVVLAISKSE